MCLGVPMQVVSLRDGTAVAEIDGVRREASLMMLAEPVALMKKAIVIRETAPELAPLVSHVFLRENAETYLRDAVR